MGYWYGISAYLTHYFSNGFIGVNRLTGLPNGKPLSMAPSNGIEVHGPYQHGAGWPAVNGDYKNLDLFDPNTPPQEYPSNKIGLGQANQFTSEFGTATWSSFERLILLNIMIIPLLNISIVYQPH